MPPVTLFNSDTETPEAGVEEPLASGNFGTVDVGGADNSTAVLERQILHGITQEDLAYHGGELSFNAQGFLTLTGDTGISVGFKDELAAIIGQTRIIALYDSVSQPGNTAEFVVTKFVGVRVMDVRLVGALKKRHIVIQPANVIDGATIPDADGQSQFVHCPVRLVR